MNRIQAVYRDGRIQIIGQINGQIDWPNGIAVEVTPMEQPRATTEWQEGYFDDTAGALAGEPFESLDRGQLADLDALSDLAASYEDSHYKIEPATDADMLRHLLDAKGITQIELHRETGVSKSSISEILSGKKQLSRHLIRKFADYFGVDASLLAGSI